LYTRERFLPEESFMLGLADPRRPISEASRYVSKKELVALQHRLNPKKAGRLADDKTLFYPYCMALGIPVPQLFAVLNPPTGWRIDGKLLCERDDWHSLFLEFLPESFVIKPAEGVHGKGIHVLNRKGDDFIDAMGEHRTVDELYEEIHGGGTQRRALIQERLESHADLGQLTGTSALQTVRVVTLVTERSSVRVLNAGLRIIVGSGVTDNFDFGRSGNLVGRLDLGTGRISKVFGVCSEGIDAIVVSHHPRTQLPFGGFELPFWSEVLELVRAAAPRFIPMRTMGWDVAVTPTGPVLVEGNPIWDPPNIQEVMPAVAAELRSELAETG
jgi:hypothetical protein